MLSTLDKIVDVGLSAGVRISLGDADFEVSYDYHYNWVVAKPLVPHYLLSKLQTKNPKNTNL